MSASENWIRLPEMSMVETASFGYWVRRQRKALDLTQGELARQVGCALVTVQKIEADERRPSRQLAELLATALAIPDEEHGRFVEAARGQRPAMSLPVADRPLAAGPGYLPTPPNSFIGRRQELSELGRLLAHNRLLTMVGPGGVGKTRLALQLAVEQQVAFPDGAYFVSLAPLHEPGQLIQAIAQTLGLTFSSAADPFQVLQRELRARRLLLLLDNFEHLLPAATLVGELIQAAPGLSVLATSRQPLALYGEQEYPLSPLKVPDLRRPELWPLLSQSEAVDLFLQRGQAAKPGFQLTASNALAIAEICCRLDGLPLAIELAAARVRFLSPEELLQRLSRRLPTLVDGPRNLPARQQTLRNTIEWSYDLLTPESRRLFRRLAVFEDGFSLAAAAAVAGEARLGEARLREPGEPAHAAAFTLDDEVTALAARSLLRKVESESEARFDMLQTIREFAVDELEAAGEGAQTRERHLAYYTALAETAEPHLFGAGQVEWLNRLEREHANLRAALQWGLAGEDEHGRALSQRMAGVLGWFWHFRGHWAEGRRWLMSALGHAQSSGIERARLLCGAGLICWAQEDYADAYAYLSEAEMIATPADHPWTRAHILGLLGLTLIYQERYAEAEPPLQESQALFRDLDNLWGIGVSLIRLSLVIRSQHRWSQARQLSEESLALFQSVDNQWGIATSISNMAEEALGQGNWQEAAVCYSRALPVMRRTGSHWYIALTLIGVAAVAAAQGKLKSAAQTLGVSERMVEQVSGGLPPPERQQYERVVTAARARLGDDGLARALGEGRQMPSEEWEQLVATVLAGSVETLAL